jgi:hypothetical protein
VVYERRTFIHGDINNPRKHKDISVNTMINSVVDFFCTQLTVMISGFGDLEDACWPLVPKFAGSNPAEAEGFLRAKKSSARLPSEGK